MKRIFTAVTILVAIAITESCRKHELEQSISTGKVIKQSPRASAKIQKL
ncbi:hypothetical protein [Mucilaginibacter hurinus]|nr:hypothetical protein [Mucilaginibacter hurinus]